MNQVGYIYKNGYKVVANYGNRIVLCHKAEAVEPWVVWYIGYDGTPYTGHYTSSQSAAMREFVARIIA